MRPVGPPQGLRIEGVTKPTSSSKMTSSDQSLESAVRKFNSMHSEGFLVVVYTATLVMVIKVATLACGYLFVRMGYRLIADGVEGKFHFKTEWKGATAGAKADLASVSPGLLFVLLGCWLCGFALYVSKPVSFESGAPIQKTQLPHTPFDEMPGLPVPKAQSSAGPASGPQQ